MIENEELLLNEIDGQLEYASTLIDLGKFDDSFKLCEEIRRNLDVLPHKSKIYSLLLFKLAGLYVDIGNRDTNEEASNIGLRIIESDTFESIVTRDSYFYCLGNAKSNLIKYDLKDSLKTNIDVIKELSVVSSIYWKAILYCRQEGESIPPRYLVNIAINLYQQNRYVEALALFDEAILIDIDIPEAWVQRSYCLILISQVNNNYSIKQLSEISNGYYKASKSKYTSPLEKTYYFKTAKEFEKTSKESALIYNITIEDDSHLNEQEYQSLSGYRKWCLDNFLSLSEHGLYCKCIGSARDNLTIPLTTRGIHGDFIPSMEKVLNRLKSEFGLARLMFYEYQTLGIEYQIEHEACYSELYDSELLGINIEKLRTAFRICFGILDKIGNAIAVLFDLQIKKKNRVIHAPFHNFWNLNEQDRLDKFNSYDNAGLIALYSIACNLNHNFQGELNFYKQWRNALEHSFVFIYKGTKPNETESAINYYGEPDFISEDKFVESAKHVLQLTRSAIFSFVYAVRIKAERDTPKEAEFLYQKRTMQRKNYVSNTDS